VEDFAKYIRQYQTYLFREGKLSPGTIEDRTAAARSFRQDTAPAVSSRSHSISQAPAATADHSGSERSAAADGLRREPDAPHHADDALGNGSVLPMVHLKPESIISGTKYKLNLQMITGMWLNDLPPAIC
jgi:hypothetical protein